MVHTGWVVCADMGIGSGGGGATAMMLIFTTIGILFLVLALNSLLSRVRPAWMFRPPEMMVIYSMTTLSAAIAGFDLLQNLLPILLWPFHYDTPSMNVERFFRHIPSHCIPQDPWVREQFFLGGRTWTYWLQPAILKAWAVPLLFWGAFLATLSCATLCLASLMRQHWMDHEKLAFPLLELPVTMARASHVGALFRSPLFSLGFGVTAAVLCLNYAAGLFPMVPGVPLNTKDVGPRVFTGPPLSGMNPIFIAWWPFAIGLCYLIPLEISFSSWFFYVLLRLVMLAGTLLGWRDANAGLWSQFPYFQQLSEGAWIGLFMVVMWGARGHLGRIIRSALGRAPGPADRAEALPHRWALFGAGACYVALVGASILGGMRPAIAAAFFAIWYLSVVVMARIFAQIAIPIFEPAYYSVQALLVDCIGTRNITRPEGVVMTHYHVFNRTYRQHVMGHELEALVFAGRVGAPLRPMAGITLLSIATGIVVGLATILAIYYRYGAASGQVGVAQVWVGSEGWMRLQKWDLNPLPPQVWSLTAIGVSVAVVLLLALARNTWFGFPLHPIGYGLASCYSMEYVWNIVLVTWLLKLLVIRFGGLRLHRKVVPLFYGIIVGDAVTQMAGALLLSLLGVKGVSPYYR